MQHKYNVEIWSKRKSLFLRNLKFGPLHFQYSIASTTFSKYSSECNTLNTEIGMKYLR